MKVLSVLTLTLAAMLVPIAALAADLPAVLVDREGRAPLLAVKEINGIAYMNGGAGKGDVEYLSLRGNEFPLQFVFSGRGGEYTVADKVTLRRGDRELISVPDAGPILMLKVPPGRYSVDATFKGTVESRNVVVGNGISKVNWNTPRGSD